MTFEFKDPIIYFIGGKAGNGKTTTANLIKEYYENKGKKVVILQHARPIKDYAKNYFGWDGQEETKPRELLQQLSGQLIKEKLGKYDFFIHRMIEDIEILSYFFDCIIVDDIRVKEEFERPKEKFEKLVSIKVIRPDYDNGLTEAQKKHITEMGLDDYNKVDHIIYNDLDIETLREKVIKIVDKN